MLANEPRITGTSTTPEGTTLKLFCPRSCQTTTVRMGPHEISREDICPNSRHCRGQNVQRTFTKVDGAWSLECSWAKETPEEPELPFTD
jgi:hypothetical protein